MSDIHSLEIEFSKNQSLPACIALCEAYLAAKRYMEAMVVCKRGIKAAPTDPQGGAMLGRIYLEQGKLPKAQKELDTLQQSFAGQPAVLELQARMMIQQGNQAAALPLLQQAVGAAPYLNGAVQLLQQMGYGTAQTMPQQVPQMQPPMQQMPHSGIPQQVPQMQQPMQQPMQQMPHSGIPQQVPQIQQPMQPPVQPPMQQMPHPGMPQQVSQIQQPVQPQFPATGMPGVISPSGVVAAMPSAQDSDNGGVQPMEHVSDFFSSDALGFSSDSSNIETAGPGRLTILGFVPQKTGSIKTTILVFIGLMAIGAAIITYVSINSANTKIIAKLYGQVREAMALDNFPEYQHAIELGNDILKVDEAHNLTLSTMAYAHIVMAQEHGVAESLPIARDYLARAIAASPDEENEWRIGTRAYLSVVDKRYQEGIAELDDILGRSSRALVHLEAFRVQQAMAADSEAALKQFNNLKKYNNIEVRGFSQIGWYYAEHDEWSKADDYFTKGLNASKTHNRAQLGAALIDLERGVGLKERQKEIERHLKQTFAIQDELSKPVLATAYFVRSQLRIWQKKNKGSEKDYAIAVKLTGEQLLFVYRRGVALTKVGDFSQGLALLEKAASIAPKNSRIVVAMVRAQIGAKSWGSVSQTLARLKKLDSDFPRLHNLAGDALFAQKKYVEAAAEYGKVDLVKHQGPAYADAQLRIGECMRLTGKGKKAVAFFEDFLGKVPSDVGAEFHAKVICEMGNAYASSGDKKSALTSIEGGLSQYPLSESCLYHKARILGFRKGPGKQASKAYLQVAPNGIYAAEVKTKARL